MEITEFSLPWQQW